MYIVSQTEELYLKSMTNGLTPNNYVWLNMSEIILYD